MCGITGVLYADASRPVDHRNLQNMGRALAHRGPDAEGYWSEPGIGLGHRRLSIIDLSTGDQPMANEDNTLHVVFNGEIYNYGEIRERLIAKGHRFRTTSDTEVLLHLYEEEQTGLLSRLRGMFAFALWDSRNRTLLLARDHVGIKPLYIYRDEHVLLFASEPKAFFAYPGIELSLDPTALDQYLAFGVTCGTRSIFKRVEKLAPAHALTVSSRTLAASARRYWSLTPQAAAPRSEEGWIDAIRHKVTEAVRLTTIADVPVGAFLSGGVDSSVVVSTAAAMQSSPLRTFSMGFEDEAFSELPRARAVADRYGTAHHEEVVHADAAELLELLTRFYDEPFADSSALPTFLVSRMASRHVKVALSGDGGDEAFGGYARYGHDLREASLRRRLPTTLRRGPIAAAAAVWPRADWLPRVLRAQTLLTNLSLDPAEAYANTLMTCRDPIRRRLLSGDVRATLRGERVEGPILDAYAAVSGGDPLAAMIAADIAVTLPDDYLVKVDRASMANGLEARPPLLDHELLELAAAMPSTLKIRGGRTKYAFRRAFEREIPQQVLEGPKHGFEVPVDTWLRGPLRPVFESAVLSPQAPISALVDQQYAGSLYKAHLAGTSRHGQVLWTLLVLARWAERYLSHTATSLRSA